MKKTLSILIISMTIISFLLSPAYAFGFDLFKPFKKEPVKMCDNDEGLNNVVYSYDGFKVSQKVLDFVEDNDYQNIGIIIKNKRCSYKYTASITDSGHVEISDGFDGIDFKISTSHKNAIKLHEIYEESDSFGILKAAFNVKMPWKVKIKAIIFLRSYL